MDVVQEAPLRSSEQVRHSTPEPQLESAKPIWSAVAMPPLSRSGMKL
jgi:hypothetical protein